MKLAIKIVHIIQTITVVMAALLTITIPMIHDNDEMVLKVFACVIGLALIAILLCVIADMLKDQLRRAESLQVWKKEQEEIKRNLHLTSTNVIDEDTITFLKEQERRNSHE